MTVEVPTPDQVTDVAYPIAVELYEDDNDTLVRTFATDVVGSRSFQVALNIADSGSLQVPVLVSDEAGTTVNDEATDMERGRIVRFKLNGTARSAQRIRPRSQRSIDSDGNEDAQRRTVNTQGLLAEWGQAVLPPAPGTETFNIDTRHFGWMSAENDISGMDTPDFLDPLFDPGVEHPEPWVDLFTIAYDADSHRYFWFDLEIASPMSVALHVGFKDQGTVWLNSAPMGQGATEPESSWEKTRHGGAMLAAGTHRFAFEVTGLPDDTEPKFAVVCFEITDASTGRIDGSSIQFRSGYVTGTTPYDEWKASATPGGCTVTQMVKSVLSQVQDEQGTLTGWSVDDPASDGTEDSNGNALPLIADAPFAIGMKLDDWLMALAAAHCDIRVDVEGKVLHLYRWRERGDFHTTPSSAPEFCGEIFGESATSGRLPNIVSLNHEERA